MGASGSPGIVWLWLALYPLAWVALFMGSSMYWFLPAGLRLGVLWILPRRWWWKMAAFEFAGILALSLFRNAFHSPLALLAAAVLPWCVYACVVRGIGRHGRGTPHNKAVARLLACGAVAALLNAIALTAINLNDSGALPDALPRTLANYAMGDFAGVILVLPVLLALSEQFGPDRRRWRELLAHGLVLVPLAVAMGLSLLPIIDAPLYPLMLALLPMFTLSYRTGWRQGAIAHALLIPGLLAISGPLVELWGSGQLQVLVAVTGCVALLLGATAERQRSQRSTLTATVQALSLRSAQLAGAANRIATLQEEERRRIGAELHDQLGQDMTAIATRLRVVERTAVDPSVREGLASINALVSGAHTHLREAIDHLHPAVLDRFGLARALSEGPFAELMRDHDIRYDCTILGEIDALPDNIASALYRICQEATTNCVRHGCGGRTHIHLSLVPGKLFSTLTLLIEDAAGALHVDPTSPGRGLTNIRDRAQAIGADYLFNAKSGTPRHSLQLWRTNPGMAGDPID